MMKFRNLIVSAALGLAVFVFSGSAIAQTHTVKWAQGEGVLRNSGGHEARFAFGVKKLDNNPAEGRMRFATLVPNVGKVEIATDHLVRLDVQSNTAWFGGPAALHVTNASGAVHRYAGRLEVHVRDNVVVGTGDHTRIVDLMQVQFHFADSTRVFGFDGWSERTSIAVGIRRF